MKKIVAIVIACMMLFAGMGSAFAEEGQNPPVIRDEAVEAAFDGKFAVLKEFRDELHTLNGKRVEHLGLKAQIVHKQDQILDLTIQAWENGDKEALKEAAKVKKVIHAVNQELRNLHQKMETEMKGFRQAVKEANLVQAQVHIDTAIGVFTAINAKLGQKAGLYDQIIDILN
jgi:hypothetical protein